MAKKENPTKSFVLRIDADTMDALKNGQLMSSVVRMDNFSGLYQKHYAKTVGRRRKRTFNLVIRKQNRKMKVYDSIS